MIASMADDSCGAPAPRSGVGGSVRTISIRWPSRDIAMVLVRMGKMHDLIAHNHEIDNLTKLPIKSRDP